MKYFGMSLFSSKELKASKGLEVMTPPKSQNIELNLLLFIYLSNEAH